MTKINSPVFTDGDLAVIGRLGAALKEGNPLEGYSGSVAVDDLSPPQKENVLSMCRWAWIKDNEDLHNLGVARRSISSIVSKLGGYHYPRVESRVENLLYSLSYTFFKTGMPRIVSQVDLAQNQINLAPT